MSRPEDTACYLPLDLKSQAKKAGLNLSRLLRTAVEQELARRKALLGSAAHEVLASDGDLLQRVTLYGVVLLENPVLGSIVYLTEDHQVIGYEHRTNRLIPFNQPDEQLREWLIPRDYLAVMKKLDLPPRVEIGRGGLLPPGFVSRAAAR